MDDVHNRPRHIVNGTYVSFNFDGEFSDIQSASGVNNDSHWIGCVEIERPDKWEGHVKRMKDA